MIIERHQAGVGSAVFHQGDIRQGLGAHRGRRQGLGAHRDYKRGLVRIVGRNGNMACDLACVCRGKDYIQRHCIALRQLSAVIGDSKQIGVRCDRVYA